MGVPLAHLPVGTVVSTARLGDHPVGNSPACSLQSLVSQVRDLKQEVGMIGMVHLDPRHPISSWPSNSLKHNRDS